LAVSPWFSLSPSPRPRASTRFPYTTLFRSDVEEGLLVLAEDGVDQQVVIDGVEGGDLPARGHVLRALEDPVLGELPGQFLLRARSEEHTSELQSRFDLVCRLLLEKKKTTIA